MGTSNLATYQNALNEAKEAFATFNFVENLTADDNAKVSTKKENATRQATCEIRFQSTGTGQRRNKTPITFPVIFRKEPHFTSGSATVKHPDPTNWHDPIGTVGLYAWRKDARGYYIGCLVWTRVDCYPVDDNQGDIPPQNMVTQHYLSFTGQAIKDIPTSGKSGKTNSLKPRTVGI